jgi:hypothetical protein
VARGRDQLDAGADSKLDGGPGDDRLTGSEVARLVCGPGRDVAYETPPPRPADCEGSPTWFGFLGEVTVAGHALRASTNLSEYHYCGVRVQAVTNRGRAVATPVRTRRTKPMSLRLPLSARGASRPPAVVRLRVRIARSCPSGRKPWRSFDSGRSVLLMPSGPGGAPCRVIVGSAMAA